MSMSCRGILKKLLFNGAITQNEFEQIERNLKTEAETQDVVQGEWISTGKGNLTSRCSICDYKSLERGNFCHNCGIAMRKES